MDEHGARRIDSPNDFVRIEIEAALKRGVPVVPVYVDDAKFLREADLPDGLKDLAWYNGYNLRTDGHKFAASIASLIANLEPHFTDAIRPAQPKPKPQPAKPSPPLRLSGPHQRHGSLQSNMRTQNSIWCAHFGAIRSRLTPSHSLPKAHLHCRKR